MICLSDCLSLCRRLVWQRWHGWKPGCRDHANWDQVCLFAHFNVFFCLVFFLTIIRRPFYFKSTQTCLGVTFIHAFTRAMCTFLLTRPQKFIFRKWTLRAKWRHMARLVWALVDRGFVHASICSRHSLTRLFYPRPSFSLHLLSPRSYHCCFDRETVVRLQSENKMLCVQEETYRQKLVEVQAELEEAQRSKNGLETQNR